MVNNNITVVKQLTFDSAHFLSNYDGLCKNMHGHTYKFELGITGRIDEKTGMVMDFKIIKSEMNKIKELLDHKLLNEIEIYDFPKTNPTAENMVIWIRNMFQNKFNNDSITFIRLWETPTSYAEWRK
jgi:6-pyruvoyltetrahydropterin/6-carboxytetrahydropterin synthase